ncbi:MAG: hypothetical protein JO154_01395 [Chitinophaga sp.]|uniref:hypothetical protein n=1 Tax=Chitinophaga sp. TaxID=1869181 RepID=UPI0025C67BCF|nr:hypothetical protein [Chitinophaga sp.]MBV8251232.1 hypothetical protein [Chitinophaga sp.]
MIKRYILIGLLGILTACHQPPQQQTTSDADVSAYKNYIKTLSYLHTPHFYGEEMPVVESGFAIEDAHYKFDELRAARVRTADSTVVIFYFGKKKDAYSYWMTSFDSTGKVINKVDIGIRDLQDQTSKYVTKALMENDSILEYRSYYDQGYDNIMHATYNASQIKLLAIRPGGKLVWKEVKKETFPEFINAIPALSLPVAYDSTPVGKNFALAHRGNSWFDYGKLLLFDYPVAYKIGKIAVPGRSQAVLLIVADLTLADGGEIAYSPSLILVTYDANGREADRLRVCGDNGTEESEDTLSYFRIATDGTVSFQESGQDRSFPSDIGARDQSRKVGVTWDNNGSLTTTYTDQVIRFQDFDPTKLVAQGSANTLIQEPGFLAELDGWDMALMFYNFRKGHEQSFHLLTVNKEGKVLGDLELVNTLKSLHFELPKKIPPPNIDHTIWKNLTGPVRVILGNKAFSIAADGSITPQ